jgi:predicted transcriptional regulator of viral defense system
MPALKPSKLPEALLSEGRYWVTIEEACVLLNRSKQTLYPRLSELERARKLFSPAQGLYVVIPPEYRSWGVVPADWFIDPMMDRLDRRYYVSFLSAAARHGASHQAPQTFQVVVDRKLKDRDIGRIRLRFVRNQKLETASWHIAESRTGTFLLATKETTLVDLAWRPRLGGGISNVATILKELYEIDMQEIARVAETKGRGTARRLGWLIHKYRPDLDSSSLRKVARPNYGPAAVLVPGNPPDGPVEREWGLRLNGSVEPD